MKTADACDAAGPMDARRVIMPPITFFGASNWVVHSLIWSNTPYESQAQVVVHFGSDNVCIDSVLVEGHSSNGVQLIGNNSTVQNSVIRRSRPGGDGVGVLVRVARNPNVGSKVLDCEIYDTNDGFGVGQHKQDPAMACEGLIVDGNDIYFTLERYVQRDGTYLIGENSVDIKAGHDDLTAPNIVSNNRMWGVRSGVGARDGPDTTPGAVITLHRRARNLRFESNVIFDAPLAIMEVAADQGEPNGYRNVTFDGNIVTSIGRYRIGDYSGPLRNRQGMTFTNNRFSHADTLSVLDKVNDPGGTRLADTYTGNTLYDVYGLGEADDDWDTATNSTLGDSDVEDVRVWRKRWTGPELVVLPGAARRHVDVVVSAEAASVGDDRLAGS
jgi:hypothetical protein